MGGLSDEALWLEAERLASTAVSASLTRIIGRYPSGPFTFSTPDSVVRVDLGLDDSRRPSGSDRHSRFCRTWFHAFEHEVPVPAVFFHDEHLLVTARASSSFVLSTSSMFRLGLALHQLHQVPVPPDWFERSWFSDTQCRRWAAQVKTGEGWVWSGYDFSVWAPRLDARLARLVRRSFCHGDLYFHNVVMDDVVMDDNGPSGHPKVLSADPRVLLVDFEDAGVGDPTEDLSMVRSDLASRVAVGVLPVVEADRLWEAFCSGYGDCPSGVDGLSGFLRSLNWLASAARTDSPDLSLASRLQTWLGCFDPVLTLAERHATWLNAEGSDWLLL